MSVSGYNGVIDISHYQKTPAAAALSAAGVVAVVAKATQGRSNRDSTYFAKKNKLKAAGIKWGSYHYSSGSDVLLQVENYLNYAQPEDDELMALDYEPSSSGPNMSYDQMVEFVELIRKATGRYPAIYGGSLLRETLTGVTASVLSECPLWYAPTIRRRSACRRSGTTGPCGSIRTAMSDRCLTPCRASAIATATPTTGRKPTSSRSGRTSEVLVQ